MNFDDIFREMEEWQKKMTEDFFSDFESLEERIRSGEMEGDWEFKPIEGPGMKGFVARGFFRTPQPLDGQTPEPLPLRPLRREPREPLYDVSVEKDGVRLYVELPGVEEPDIKLNTVEGGLEVAAGDFNTVIKLPDRELDTGKMSTEYRNGVLTAYIPLKKEEKTDEEA